MSGVLEEVEALGLDFSEMSCQFKHDHNAVPSSCRTCLVEVTHLVIASCGSESVHLCDAAASAVRLVIRAGKVARCRTCGLPPNTHWTVRPI